MASTSDSLQQEQTFVHLDAESEWRFELESDENIAVRVSRGDFILPSSSHTTYPDFTPLPYMITFIAFQCEAKSSHLSHSTPTHMTDVTTQIQTPDPVYINSEELPPVTWYPLLRHLKSALYAPTPAKIEVSSLPASQYTSSSTTQPALISLHLALERLRILAKRSRSRGPRVMVLGPPSSGKTTVVKNLINMALSSGSGWTPGVIGLDPMSPSNLIPGSLSLSTPSHPVPTHHLAQPIGSPPASLAADTLSADVPTVGWWYGHNEPTTKGAEVWRKLVDAMGERWKERCEKDPTVLASGAVVDTSSAFVNPTLGTKKDDPKAKYTLLAHAIETFEVDTLIVVGHEKLTIDLTRMFSGLRVVRIPKSGGAVDLDDGYRQILAAQQVRGYFYGEPTLPKHLESLSGRMVGLENGLSPYSFQIGWETLTIIRVGEDHAAPTTALPLGLSRILSPTRLTRVDPLGPAHITRLLNTVLAVVHLVPGDRLRKEAKEEMDEVEDGDDEVPYREEIGWREVAGFVVITAIDTMRKKYTVLSPSPGKLPSKVAIAGSIEWVDSA